MAVSLGKANGGHTHNESQCVPLDTKEENMVVSFDDVLEELNPTGRFQITQIALLMGITFFAAFVNLSFVFLGYTPKHQCSKVNETALLSTYGLNSSNYNLHVVYKSCDIQIINNKTEEYESVMTIPCPNGRDFHQHSTYIAYWDLVCESTGQAELTYTLFSAGRIPGGFLGAMIPDKYGRKRVVVIFAAIACAFETAGIFAPNIYVLDALKFVSGFFYQSYSSCFFTYITELIVSRHRQALAAILNTAWVVCCVLVAALAYIFQAYQWQYFQAIVVLTFIPIILIQIFAKESTRWLAANNKTDKVLRILEVASKQNKKDFERVREVFQQYMNIAFVNKCKTSVLQPFNSENYDINPKNENETNLPKVEVKDKIIPDSVFKLLKNKKVLILIAMNIHIWLTHTLTYYGLYLTSTSLAGNRFINFSLMAIVELPCSFILPILGLRLSRRVLLIILLCLTTTSLLTSTLLITFGMGTVSSVFSIIGKFSISASFSFLYIFTGEIFPTNVRSTVLGHCSSASRLGSVFTPYFRPLIDIAIWAPGMIFSIMCAFALLFTWLLPETRDKDMPNTLDEFLKTSNRSKSKTSDRFCR